jgi:hypothetical protein
MVITKHGNTIHLQIDGMWLVFDKAIFMAALKHDKAVFLDAIARGKAVRRAQAQQAREAQGAAAAEQKRTDRSLT